VTATVIRVTKDTHSSSTDESPLTPSSSADHDDIKEHETAMTRNQFTLGRAGASAQSAAHRDHQHDSSKADDLAWTHFSNAPGTKARMEFALVSAAKPLSAIVQRAQQAASPTSNRSLVVVTGRGRRQEQGPHADEVAAILASQGHNPSTGAEMRKTLGDVATAVVVVGPSASFLVVQAGSGDAKAEEA
jgi:hypothetical protein